jgi:hypothetical protein
MKDNRTAFSGFADWEAQLKLMREGGPDVRAFFIRRVYASKYLVPRQAERKGLALLSTQDGELFLPAFTSESGFGKWSRPHSGAAVLSFEMLHHIVVDDPALRGVVINPFGAQLLLYRGDLLEIEKAVTGMAHERAEHKGRIFIETARCPAELARAFKDALKNSGVEVLEAYILAARQEYEEKPHLLFLIDFHGDRKILFPLVAKGVQPYMKKGTDFELLKATPLTLQIARGKTAPAYKSDSI